MNTDGINYYEYYKDKMKFHSFYYVVMCIGFIFDISNFFNICNEIDICNRYSYVSEMATLKNSFVALLVTQLAYTLCRIVIIKGFVKRDRYTIGFIYVFYIINIVSAFINLAIAVDYTGDVTTVRTQIIVLFIYGVLICIYYSKRIPIFDGTYDGKTKSYLSQNSASDISSSATIESDINYSAPTESASDNVSITCEYCGTKLDPGAEFCTMCGAKVK